MSNYLYPKAIMTVKELVEVGYPENILRDITRDENSKSVLRRKRSSGSNIYIQVNLLESDLENWKKNQI